MRAAFLLLTLAEASIWNGWRDQYVRVSPQIAQGVAKTRRRLQAQGKDFPEELKLAAKRAVNAAERVAQASRSGGAANSRRQMMDVENNGTTRVTVVNGVTIPDMSLFDCPWAASLHPYLDLSAAFAVDGGLCLPYQEVAFPYSVGINPVDTTVANIVSPGPNFNVVDINNFNLPTCRDASGSIVWCTYPGETGEPTQMAENYGNAAANAGWVDLAGNVISDADQMTTPICKKTYVEECKYSTEATREYDYEAGATITPPPTPPVNEGYDINWVLARVSGIRNSLGLESMMEQDLGLNPGDFLPPNDPPFVEGLYDTLYGLPAGTLPPTSGKYPHAYTKAEYDGGAVPAIDASKDGKCTKRDSMAQW